MSHPGDPVRLRHAVEAADKILAHASGETPETLRADERLQFTLVHLLEILGEACNHVSGSVKASPTRGTGRHRVVTCARRPFPLFLRP